MAGQQEARALEARQAATCEYLRGREAKCESPPHARDPGLLAESEYLDGIPVLLQHFELDRFISIVIGRVAIRAPEKIRSTAGFLCFRFVAGRLRTPSQGQRARDLGAFFAAAPNANWL